MPISAQFMLVMIPRIRWVQRVVWDRWPSTPVYLLGVPTAPGRLSAAARDRLEQNILAAFVAWRARRVARLPLVAMCIGASPITIPMASLESAATRAGPPSGRSIRSTSSWATSAALCKNKPDIGLWPTAAQADWPRLAGAWHGLRAILWRCTGKPVLGNSGQTSLGLVFDI